MKISFLYGANLPTLFRLLWRQKFRVNIKSIPSITLHFIFAIFNSILSIPERFQNPVKDPENPVFILGHWRNGTTHLHNLMTIDGAYTAPRTFQSAFPRIMYAEKTLTPLLDRFSPGKRLMDSMEMLMASVQEEEIGMAAMGKPSSYLAVHFPRDHARYRTFVSFRESSKKDLEEWKKAHRQFVRKVVHHNGSSQPLVLKSPANTSRVALLLEMYPDARFIHIHRNPYEVIRSTIHLYDSWFLMANFQSLDDLKARRDEIVMDTYEDMHRIWLEEKSLIPEDRLMVIGFEEIKRKPIEVMIRIYDFLGDAELDKKALQAYLDSVNSYRQNRYDPLSAELIQEINRRFAFVFEEFGYEMREDIEAREVR